MKSFRIALVPAFAAIALALPIASQASAVMHPGYGDNGDTLHLEYLKSDKTRAQVHAEAVEAIKNGTLPALTEGALPPQTFTSTKTRTQVVQELLNETPAERQLRNLQYGYGG